MRSHHVHHHHHHHAFAHAQHVGHASAAGPGGAWYVRAIESCSHFTVGWLLAGLVYLLGRLWLPVGALAAGWVAVLVWRVLGRHRLAAAGSRWELRPGEQMSRAALEAFTRTLAGGLPRRWFGASPWVVLSVSSLEDRAACDLFISGGLSPAQVRASIEQALGSVTVKSTTVPESQRAGGGARRLMKVASLGPVGSRFLPLRVDHGVDPAGQLLASLRAQGAGEGGLVQLVLQAPPRSASAKARREAGRLRCGRGLQPSASLRVLQAVASFLGEMLDMFTSSGSPQTTSRPPGQMRTPDPFSLERARAIDAKASTPLLAATLRVGGWAYGRRRARGLVGGVIAALGQYRELGGLRRAWEPFCVKRLVGCLPAVKLRLLLGSDEAAALIPLPEESGTAPLSFSEAPSRRVAPVAQAPTRGLLLGRSDHAGFDREVRVEPKALLQHAHVLGPTGRGKSTLLLNMTVEAIRAGMGGIVLDPTGELTENILARVPRERQEDVDLLDLGDQAYPPALNLLACPAGEGDAQAQAICGIFARLFARYWGPRTEDILRSALTTLLVGRDPAGPAPTLADVLTLLSDPGERSRYRASDPVALDVFWRQWQTLSEPARVQALAPLSNKLRALLGNRALRNMLCQPAAPDMRERINRGGWLLVSLPQTIGEDAADLIGSVLLHRAWQAAQRLGPLALSDRPLFLCLIDECHRFCHLPQGMATALAQARGYGLGLVLAHQHLAQVKDHELDEAIDANCQTKICFALAAADAKRMAPHFQPRLDAHDLQALGSYTIACRVLHDARELPAATATTLPPSKPTPGDTASAIRQRARDHASECRTVEGTIRERYGRTWQPPPGHAHADEQQDPDSEACGSGSVGDPPFDPPHDPPFDPVSEVGPPPPATPHHDRDSRPRGNPDNNHYLPSPGRRL